MDKNNKGLAANQDGEIILNESGTSISIEGAEEAKNDMQGALQQGDSTKTKDLTLRTEDPVILNDIASDEHSRLREGIIKPYDDVFHDHKPQEDIDEISSTDDVSPKPNL